MKHAVAPRLLLLLTACGSSGSRHGRRANRRRRQQWRQRERQRRQSSGRAVRTPALSTAARQLRLRQARLLRYLTQRHIEVWVSDASSDGSDFPNFQKLWQGDLELPFGRGYVSLALRNHATIKYWLGSAATLRWDNIGLVLDTP